MCIASAKYFAQSSKISNMSEETRKSLHSTSVVSHKMCDFFVGEAQGPNNDKTLIVFTFERIIPA